jgi:lysozyme
MNIEKLAAQLRIDEGVRSRIYLDTAAPPRWTGGVGRNLTDRPFFDDEIALMLKNDIALVESDLDRTMPWWRLMTEARQNVLANMTFNMGISRVLGFVNTLAAMKVGRYDAAAQGMLDSTWAKQVGARAIRLAAVMRSGEFA